MSRSRKGGKAAGFEYWTPRPGNAGGSSPGRFSKSRTHRAERRLGRIEASRRDASDSSVHDRESECAGCPACLCRECGGVVAGKMGEDAVYSCIDCGYSPPEAKPEGFGE